MISYLHLTLCDYGNFEVFLIPYPADAVLAPGTTLFTTCYPDRQNTFPSHAPTAALVHALLNDQHKQRVDARNLPEYPPIDTPHASSVDIRGIIALAFD